MTLYSGFGVIRPVLTPVLHLSLRWSSGFCLRRLCLLLSDLSRHHDDDCLEGPGVRERHLLRKLGREALCGRHLLGADCVSDRADCKLLSLQLRAVELLHQVGDHHQRPRSSNSRQGRDGHFCDHDTAGHTRLGWVLPARLRGTERADQRAIRASIASPAGERLIRDRRQGCDRKMRG